MTAQQQIPKLWYEVRDALLAEGLTPTYESEGDRIIIKKKKVGRVEISIVKNGPGGLSATHIFSWWYSATKYGGYEGYKNDTATGPNAQSPTELAKATKKFLDKEPLTNIEKKPTDPREGLLANLIGRLIAEKCNGSIKTLAKTEEPSEVCRVSTQALCVKVWPDSISIYHGYDNEYLNYDKFTCDPEKIANAIKKSNDTIVHHQSCINQALRTMGQEIKDGGHH